MRWDFTEATRLKMLESLEEIKKNRVWAGIKTFLEETFLFASALLNPIGRAIKIINRHNPLKALEKLIETVIGTADTLAEGVNSMFKLANDTDEKYAGKAVNLESAGQDLLTFLKEFTEMAEKGDLSSAGSPEKLEKIIGLKHRIIFKRAMITDIDLIKFCEDEILPGYVYRKCVVMLNEALTKIGTGTAFLIALFNHDDILIGQILSTDYGQQVRGKVRDMMLEGEEGLTNPAEIAKALGIDEDAVLYYLKNGNVNGYYNNQFPDVREGFQPYGTDINSPMRIAELNTSIEKYIKENLDTALNNETLCMALCERLDLDKEIVEAIVNGEIDAYQMSLYKENIWKSVDDMCKYMATEDLSEANKIFKGIKDFLDMPNDGYKIATLLSGEKGKEVGKMWKDNLLSDEEATKFLRDYCNIEDASPANIDRLRSITRLFNESKGISKALKYGSKASEALEFWLTDYGAELDMLDKLIEANDDPACVLAMKELKEEYTNKFATRLENAAEDLIKKGVGEAKDAVTPLLTVAETAIDLGGKVTGAKDHTDAAEQILAYSSICPKSIDAYEKAVEAVKANPADEKALTQVKTTFSMMKQSLEDYYDVQIDFYDGYAFGIGRDKSYQDYLNYHKTKLENLQLGDKFDPISYDKFMEDFSG